MLQGHDLFLQLGTFTADFWDVLLVFGEFDVFDSCWLLYLLLVDGFVLM